MTTKNRQGAETRRQLVKVAERLFAERGLDGVSIRAVNAEAQVGAASIHYHFGSKDGLLAAVVDEHGAWVSQRVTVRVQTLSQRSAPAGATEIVEAIALPYLELLERDRVRGLRWVQITAQLAMAGDDRLAELYPAPTSDLAALLLRAFEGVASERIEARWSVASRTLIQMLAHADRWSGDLREYVVEVTGFVAGGLAELSRNKTLDLII